MIRTLALFAFSKLRLFALVAIVLVGAGSLRTIDEFVPDFSEKVDEFVAQASHMLHEALRFGETDNVADAEAASRPEGLATRLSRLFSFRADSPTSDDALVTGSTAEAADKMAEPATASGSAEAVIPGDAGAGAGKGLMERSRSQTEELILQKLGERRELLDKREEELNNREALLKASELRITQRIAELKVLEADLKAKIDSRNEQLVSLKPLVVMYEAMKPKDAAQVFENLEYATLVELVAAINPRKVSDVVAVMEPKLASRVTKDLATRGRANVTVPDNSAAILDKATELPDLPQPN